MGERSERCVHEGCFTYPPISNQGIEDSTDDVPEDYDDDDIAEYAAEQELLDGLTPEDIFTYSDIDDVPCIDVDEELHPQTQDRGKRRALDLDDGDVEMDL